MSKNKFKLKKFPKKKKLPVRLSEWITEAVDDAIKLSKTPGFKLNMDIYNEIDEEEFDDRYDKKNKDFGTCHVCLGGAAIVGCGLVAPGDDIWGNGAEKIAHALDSVRNGDLSSALEDFGFGRPTGKKAEVIDELNTLIHADFSGTRDNGRAKFSTYRKVAKKLAAIGL